MNSKENLSKSIEKSGWFLTKEAIDEFLAEFPNLNSNDLVKKALNCDLRNIGNKSLPDILLNVKQDSVFQANHVLQLSKLKNIAAPKSNESCMTAPPMYRITLTDGNSNLNALVIDDLNKLNLNTPPGTKLFLHGPIKMKSNFLILNNQNCQVLGGTVDYLVTKWKQAKDLAEHVRVMNLTETAPPPWVPFGTRQTSQVDTSKKVFAEENKPETETSTEFSQARQAALAEAMQAKSKITKTFTQTTVDKSQIETAAAAALSTTANKPYSAPPNITTTKKPEGRKGKGKNKNNLLYEDENDFREAKDAAKPSAVTLFDLFKTKLDIKDEEKPQVPEEPQATETFGRGSRYNNPRSNHRNQNRHQQFQNKPREEPSSKQTYNKDDFSYELGDTTKVKELIKVNPTNTANSSSNSSKANSNSNTTPDPFNQPSQQRNTQKTFNNNNTNNNSNKNNNFKPSNFNQQQQQQQQQPQQQNTFKNQNDNNQREYNNRNKYNNNNNNYQQQGQYNNNNNRNNYQYDQYDQYNQYDRQDQQYNNYQQQNQYGNNRFRNNNNNNNYNYNQPQQQYQQDYKYNQNQSNNYRNNNYQQQQQQQQQQGQFNNNYNNNYRNDYPQNQNQYYNNNQY